MIKPSSRYRPLIALLTVAVVLCPARQPARSDQVVQIAVHPTHVLGKIHRAVLGVNSDSRYDGADAFAKLSTTFKALGITASRWPGGTHADVFDWRGASPRYCDSFTRQPNNADGTFDQYMTTLIVPNGLDPELTVNYGTTGSGACAGPGDPAMAAAWVRYANVTKGYGVKWWEVGNEVYEAGEPDNHPAAHTSEAYGTYEPAFYAAMKAADPTINVGIPITAGSHRRPDWDAAVLASARFDYVVYHYYPEFYPYISDAGLLAAPTQGTFAIARIMSNIRSRLVDAGKCTSPCMDFPISVSEWNSVSHNPTPQTMTIVEGLFAAETLGEFFNAGVTRAEFWNDWACQVNSPGRLGYNTSSPAAVYSWQRGSGSQGITAVNGVPDPVLCPGASFSAPPGTIFPSGRAFELYSKSGFAIEGSDAVAVDDPSSTLRVYAAYNHAQHQHVVMLINLDKDYDTIAQISIDGAVTASYRSLLYSKEIYDQTKENGPWNGLTEKHSGKVTFPLNVTVPRWSMTTYTFNDLDSRRYTQ